ncbi:Ig-like domain-containing protein [Candidatus Daviesbacteria bacterium]|nr:Ig-like domain-containing protein [Candidatus Daviesbacteria bacterium]
MSKGKIIFLSTIILILLFLAGFFLSNNKDGDGDGNIDTSSQAVVDDSKPRVVSVQPTQQEAPFITQNQVITVTFNMPVENTGEFKHKIEPELKYRLEPSADRKVIKITPEEPYLLGTEYTLFIKPETKFDGKKTLNEEKIYHFKTIQYRGV